MKFLGKRVMKDKKNVWWKKLDEEQQCVRRFTKNRNLDNREEAGKKRKFMTDAQNSRRDWKELTDVWVNEEVI